MTIEDIIKIRDLGETSKVQFKERLDDAYKAGCELMVICYTNLIPLCLFYT